MPPLSTSARERPTSNHVTTTKGISLLLIGKIMARVLLNRLLKQLEQGHLPQSQCGFRTGRRTTDMVFAARQNQEKSMEQHQDLYITFVDLTKAFDTVSREGLCGWSCRSSVARIGSWRSSDFFTMGSWPVCSMMDTPQTHFRWPVERNRAASLPPRCSFWCYWRCWQMPSRKPPLAFPSIAGAMGNSSTSGVYRPSPKSRRLCADDCALNANNEQSTKKTEMMYQPAPGIPYQEPNITVKDQRLQAVENFLYLSSTL